MTAVSDAESGATLGRPRWASALTFAVLASTAVCWPDWPGQMSYDSLHAYEASIIGIKNMVWPPMHAYLFWLSRQMPWGPGVLFAAQTFAIFLGAAVSASLLVRRRAAYLASLVGFAGLFVLVPPMLGVIQVQWRDVTTASFTALGLAFWLMGARGRSTTLLVVSALALGGAVSLRYNAFPLFALWIPLMIWRPFLGEAAGARVRAITIAALVASLGLAWASTQWRLPDFKHMPPPNTLSRIRLFDLLGVSACEGTSYVPLIVTQGEEPLTGEQVRKLYDPRHLQLAFGPHPGVPQFGLLQKQTAQGAQAIDAAWRATIPTHLRCYFEHRSAVFAQQMGMTRGVVFYPTHGSIDANPWGIRFAHPAAAEALREWVSDGSLAWWRRPALLYLGAGLIAMALALQRDPRALLALALLGGACANAALLYLIGPAADARYIFPGNVLCALVIAVGLAILADRPGLAPAGLHRQAAPQAAGRRR